ncbi:MAG: heavy metal translocating P-type ATPase [Caldilineaceae bacterium]
MVVTKSQTFTRKLDTVAQDVRGTGTAIFRKLRAGWRTVQPLIHGVQVQVEKIEREQLDPLLDRALDLWGDRRLQQHQLLGGQPLRRPLTEAELAINHGLYVSASSFGLAVAGYLFFPPLSLLSLAGMAYSSLYIYQKAYHAVMEEHKLDLNVLAALVNVGYIGSGLAFWGTMTNTSYFFSLRMLGTVKDRFTQELLTAFTLQARPVWLLVDGEEVKGWLETLKVGDVVIVRAGEMVPVDGTILEGLALIDQQVLTGEASPIEKSVGAPVFAATLVLTSKIYIKVEKTGAETTSAQIGRILKETIDFRTQHQLRTHQLTDKLVLPYVALSAATLPFLGLSSAAAVLDAHPQFHINTLSSLNLLNFLLVATRRGILIKDGRSLELLNEVDTLIFDKTGTLTQAQPQVAALHCCANISAENLLIYAATAEQYQSHPIAHAILAEAKARQLTLPAIDEATYKLGYGLTVTLKQATIHVGSTRFLELERIPLPAQIQQVQADCIQQGHSLVLVALNNQLIGAVELHPVARPEVKTVLTTLRQRRRLKSFIIISGDQVAPTARLAQELGIDEYFAEVLPANKAELIAQLQAAGRKVCFIGDGINDAVALKQADVSISLQGATTAATDTAHIVLMDGSLHQLLTLFELTQEFAINQRKTIWAVLTPGLVGLVGVYTLGIGLPAMTILDMLDLTIGASIAMRPWVNQRQLAQLNS